MIRVNLLKSAGAAAMAGQSTGSDSLSPETQKQAGMRMGAILGAIAILYIYNMFVVSAQKERLAGIETQIAQVQRDKDALGPTTPLVEKYNSEKKTLEGQLDVLRQLARNRLREVKALDSIQSLMSEKTWLKEVRTQDGSLSMVGYSFTDDGITDLIRALDSSVFFSDLIVKSTSEEKVDNATVKKFEVEFKIGARNE